MGSAGARARPTAHDTAQTGPLVSSQKGFQQATGAAVRNVAKGNNRGRSAFNRVMETRKLYVAAYDVRDDKRLRRALQVMKGYATGGQKSVFECFLTEGERNRLLAAMKQTLDLDVDSLLLVELDPRMEVLTYGIAVPPRDPPFFYAG